MFKKLRRHLFGPTWFERGYEAAQEHLKLYPVKVLHEVWLAAGGFHTKWSQGYWRALVEHSIDAVVDNMAAVAAESIVAQLAADDEM